MRMAERAALALLASVTLVAVPAHAQEAGQVGVTMGYPVSVGLIWHVTDRVAVRPEFNFSTESTETHSAVLDSEGDSWSFGTGVAALFALRQWDDVRAYAGPRFTYSRTDADSSSELDDITELRTRRYGLDGLFGVQYTPHSRFAVFGELAFGYSNRETTSDQAALVVENRGWGTHTGAGIIFYFGR